MNARQHAMLADALEMVAQMLKAKHGEDAVVKIYGHGGIDIIDEGNCDVFLNGSANEIVMELE